MTEFKPIKEGKVREIYDNGDSLIMVATDRISAFDDKSRTLSPNARTFAKCSHGQAPPIAVS